MALLSGMWGVNSLHPLDPARFFYATLGGQKTKSGENITPDSALRLPAYFAAIRVISEDVGKYDFFLYERDSNSRTRRKAVDNDDFAIWSSRPHPDLSSQQWRELMVQWALNWGGGISEIVRNVDGSINRLIPIHPSRVTISRENDRKVYKVRTDSGQDIPLDANDVLHFYGFGDYDSGYSLAGYMAEQIGVGHAATKFGATFLGKGMRPSGIITSSARLGAEEQQNLKQMLDGYSGAGDTGKTLIMSDGLDFKATQIRPDEAQFIETIKNNTIEIARAVRVNPNKLQDWDRATYNNMEQANTDHINDALLPWFLRIEHEVNYKIYKDRPALFVKHDLNSILRADLGAQAEYNTKMFRIGALNINEMRDQMDMDPIENGDTHYYTQDLAPVGTDNTDPVSNTDAVTMRREKAFAALKPMLESMVNKCLSKEHIAFEKAVKRGDIIAWSDSFFTKHSKDFNCLDSFCVSWFEATGVDISENISVIVDNHIINARSSIVDHSSIGGTLSQRVHHFINNIERDIVNE